MENLKRPSIRETDEDLLKQQELFLKNKERPSVSVKKKSQSESLPKTFVDSPKNETSDVQQSDQLFVHQEEVFFEVKERAVSNEPFVFTLPSLPPDEVINSLDKKLKSSKFAAKRKEKSIFAQLMKEEVELKTPACLPASSYGSLLVDGSGLENGSEDAKKLHEENQLKVSTMSEEEILKYQEQLRSSLDPSILKFIQSKRKMKKGIPQSSKSDDKTKHLLKKAEVVQATNEDLSSGEILRQEGRSDCDALILQNSLEQATEVEKPNTISNMKHKNTALPEEAKKLLHESKKRKWRNMDKIEKEKLEWLSELPKPNPIDLKTGYTARFDFEGKLLAHDVDVPTHKGLHHHGEEPEIAGYSLEELFLLARSTLQSQRITALHTIAHILDNYWYGRMDSCFDSPLLPTLLEAGIVPLLRWSLDDTSVTSVAATITAIHSLLISKPDEACLHKTFCWLNGHLLPQIEPTDLEEPNVVVEELTDAHLIKLDVIKGFLRIDILPRFLYVLQVMQPPPLVCKLIIEICCHLAQHSSDSSGQVAKHPGLLKLIFEKFLPFTWQFVDGNKLTDTVNYSCPLPSAMKLIRIIASSNKELALYLIENFDLVKVMTLYLTIRPADEKLSPSDVQSVMVETLKTLHILLRYGCGFQIVLDLYPILLRQMEFCLSLNLNAEDLKLCQDFEYASHFFKTLEAVVIVSAEETERFELNTLVNAIFKQSLVCLKKWLHQMKQENISDRAMTLLAAALNFVSIFYKKSHKGLTCDDWEPCSAVKDMYTGYLIPCIRSEVFKNMLDQIQSYSLLLSSEQSGNKRDGQTLVSLGSVVWEGDVVPILKERTPVPFLLATLNFIFVHKTLFNDGDNQFLEELLSNTSLLEYMRKISVKKLSICSWFARYETYLLTLLLKLSPFIAHNNSLDWHRIAISLLPILRMPDECLIEDLFENIIFNEAFLQSSNITTVHDIIATLPVIVKCYISYFLDERLVVKSRNLLFGGLELHSVSFLSNPKPVLPKDWCYAPIFDLYHDSSKKKASETLAPEDLLLITSSLQWTLLCRELSLPLLKDILASVEFCYFSMVFLLDCDCFRHQRIRFLLEANLLGLLRKRTVNFSKIISDNVGSFDDLYLELLNQFEAVSYGDHLFGNYILVPLQQCYHNRWKKVLLTDHSDAIPFLRVPLAQLVVPLQNYLEPFESDIEILKGYLNLLLNGSLTHQRCPLLYLMAVHHIHHFIFLTCSDHIKSQKFLVMSITHSKKEILKHHLLLYSEANIESEFGFTLKTELSQSDERHLSDIAGRSVKL